MRNEIENLISHIKHENNPLIVANKISYFLSDALREGKISLYEAFRLNGEKIKFRRMGYTQSAWQGRVRIATCLAILNQKMLAHFFDEHEGAEKLNDWGLEAYNLNNENRAHYIMDRYNLFLEAYDSRDLLEELQYLRNKCEELSIDDGPYHTDVFPCHFYSPEEILLGKTGRTEYKKNLDEAIVDLIVELNMK